MGGRQEVNGRIHHIICRGTAACIVVLNGGGKSDFGLFNDRKGMVQVDLNGY